ncbi:DegV family protein [Peptacetobacter sp.]|uniref:DegV family protein n=1 Tax=unclassified Peptacetobacter TaxID=2991974 RepID=UPI00260AA1EC|nr:DegV family protein [Peptacetobacter sp.]MEE0450695.1 DegV family protein [Peptacetobacter sp.]
MREYQIFTDATSDLQEDLESVKVIPMNVEIGDKEYVYGPQGNISCKEFYGLQKEGYYASTSQINVLEYEKYFEEALKEGKDVLYISFSSGMSGTYQTACLCKNELQESYPDQRIICIDSLCAAVGEGLLVEEVDKKKREGLSMDELVDWIEDNKMNLCHWFTVDNFDHLKHGGRVSAVAATLGNTLNIKPLLRVDEEGKLRVVKKIRGRHKAMAAQVECIAKTWSPEISKSVVIGHGDDLKAAEELKEYVENKLPDAEIYISDIGPIIGAHTGPGVMVLAFWGTSR